MTNPLSEQLEVPNMIRLTPHASSMTLRDYFAGQALAGGLIAHHGYPLQTDEVASDAYAIADAMLVARARSA